MAEWDDIDAVTAAVLSASRLLMAISAKALAVVEDTVTLPQFRLLMTLTVYGPTKLVVLADRLGVNPSTAMRMVDRLAAVGLVSRDANPHVRREIRVALTDDGQRTVGDVNGRRRQEITSVVARLAPHQRVALVEALRAFAEAGEDPIVSAASTGDALPYGWG